MNCDIKRILRAQLANELTESVVYSRLAEMQKEEKNRVILENIGRDESAHAQIISELLGEKGEVNRLAVARVVFNARVFGLTFALKLMEKGEKSASLTYKGIQEEYPQLARNARADAMMIAPVVVPITMMAASKNAPTMMARPRSAMYPRKHASATPPRILRHFTAHSIGFEPLATCSMIRLSSTPAAMLTAKDSGRMSVGREVRVPFWCSTHAARAISLL